MADGMKAPVKISVSQDRKTMSGVPKGRLMAGAYKVTWRAASADDGHRMDGAFTFTVK
jgi:methionine-rich copper-binding protein CopC